MYVKVKYKYNKTMLSANRFDGQTSIHAQMAAVILDNHWNLIKNAATSRSPFCLDVKLKSVLAPGVLSFHIISF